MRSNCEILATTAFPTALLYYIDPFSKRPPVLLYNFTSLVSTTGIAKMSQDMFYIAAADSNGRQSIHSVNMRHFLVFPNGTLSVPPVIKEVGSIPLAIELNGITHIHGSVHFILIADTLVGGVWKFDIYTGNSEFVVQDITIKGPPNETSFRAFGINGARFQNGKLFYTNSRKQTIHRILLTSDGTRTGNATLIASGVSCDDSTVDPRGFAYVASPSNALIHVDTCTGAQVIVAGTFLKPLSDIVATSAQFGTTPRDRTNLYMTTNGGSFTDAPVGS